MSLPRQKASTIVTSVLLPILLLPLILNPFGPIREQPQLPVDTTQVPLTDKETSRTIQTKTEDAAQQYYSPRAGQSQQIRRPGVLSWRAAEPEGIKFLLGPDAIPAIHTPQFLKPGESDVRDNELVIGFILNHDARAYPISVMNHHEVVNDLVGGVPVAITFCPLCGTAIVFERTVNGDVMAFGVSGGLFHNNLVMYDTKTLSLWPQMLGQAVFGPLSGLNLKALPSDIVRWGAWKELFPQTTILKKPTNLNRNYDFDPYRNYVNNPHVAGVLGWENPDYRIQPKQFVLGLITPTSQRVYQIHHSSKFLAINADMNRVPVVIIFDPESGISRVYLREVDGIQLSFEVADKHAIRDKETGSLWSVVLGRAEIGPMQGRTLNWVYSFVGYWFCWKDYFPQSVEIGTA